MKNHRHNGQIELILQAHPSENGAAALAMVLSSLGKPAPMRELTGQPIASAADLVSAARSRGVYAQGYRMSFDELCRAPLPLIAHWRFRSFVVVTGVRGGRVFVNSPEEGRLILSRKEFEAGFTGAAVCFAAEGEPAERPADRPVRELLSQDAAVPALLAAVQLFLAAGYAALAVLLRGVAAQMSSPQSGGGLPLCLKLAGVLLAQGAAVAFQLWLIRRCRTARQIRSGEDFQRRLDSGDVSFFRRTSPFRLSEAAGGCRARPEAMARAAACGAQLAGGALCLVVLAVQDLAAAGAAALAAAVFGAVCLARRERLYSDEKCRGRAEFLTEELARRDLAAGEEHRLRGQDGARFQHWAGEAGGACRPGELERQRGFWYIAASAALLAVLCVCLLEMIAGWAGTADLLSCLTLTAAAAASMGALPCLLAEQAASRRFRESAMALPDAAEEQAPSGGGTAGTLTIQNVTLRPAGEGTVKDVTFTVRRGEILVVTAGADVREVLAVTAAGLERPAQGEVYLDSRNTAELTDRELCRQITLMGSGIPFPRGTVRENIAAGFSGITDYAVMEAASNALLHESILLRERGYDTPADTLSAGERVLLEFARAFARGTPFLVCNDLTGILDAETEDRLIRNLRRRGIGAVLLTEDPALPRKGDLVCRIEQGRTALRERAEFVEGEVDCLV